MGGSYSSTRHSAKVSADETNSLSTKGGHSTGDASSATCAARTDVEPPSAEQQLRSLPVVNVETTSPQHPARSVFEACVESKTRRPSCSSLGKSLKERIQLVYDIMDHPEDRSDFVTYLKDRHCAELIAFFDEYREFCVDFRSGAMSGAECQRSFRLYDEYLTDGGRFSVNLGEKAAKLRARIHSGLMNQDFGPSMFEDAVDACLTLVTISDLPNFTQSQRLKFGPTEPCAAPSHVLSETNLWTREFTRAPWREKDRALEPSPGPAGRHCCIVVE